MHTFRALIVAVAVLAGVAAPRPASADDLKLGISAAFTSLDPHFFVATANIMISRYMFDALTSTNERQQVVPALAESWEAKDDLRWEFKLRPDVVFSDGTPLTANDIAASLARAPDVEGSPSSFALYTRSIANVDVIDPLTLVIETAHPNPTLPVEMSYISIIPEKLRNATTDAFNNLEATIGTGPFIPVNYVPNDHVEFVRNPNYWGPAPEWETATVRLIANNGARSAALLAGDVDVIDAVPPADIERIQASDNTIVSAVSNRVIFVGLDQERDESPFVSTPDGGNPLKNLLVRKALTHAIDREAIAARIMKGAALPAGQFLPDGFFGVSENLDLPEYDPEMARALLEESGFADKVKLTITGPSDRYLNASQVLQAIAQMFNRIGVETGVEMLPWSNYVSRLRAQEISAFFGGWGSVTGETGVSMLVTTGTVDPDRGSGGGNRGRYSNPDLDALLAEAARTIDNDARNDVLARASELVIGDVGLMPIYFEITNWGLRDGLTMQGRADQATLAASIRSQ